jgi:hypothetical protein
VRAAALDAAHAPEESTSNDAIPARLTEIELNGLFALQNNDLCHARFMVFGGCLRD